MESLLKEYRTDADPWETRSNSKSPEIKPDLPMEIPSLLLQISNSSLDKTTHAPGLVENMVTVDHDLSGGVISTLYPENGDAVEGTTPSSTKEKPYKTTCKEVDDEEVYPEKLPSTIPLKTSLTDTLNPSVNKGEPLISVTDHFSPREEETKATKPEVAVPGCSSPPDEVPSILKEQYSDCNKPSYNEPTLWEWETKSKDDDEISYTSEEMPWYDRKPLTRKTPLSYKPEVTVQGWMTQPNEVSYALEEELSDYESIISKNESSDNETVEASLSKHKESTNSNSTYIMSPSAQETKRKMEAAIPNPLRWLLGWPEIPSPTTCYA